MTDGRKLFVFGCGFSARALIERLKSQAIEMAGTTRSAEKAGKLEALGVTAYLFDAETGLDRADEALAGVTHLLLSVPPGKGPGDPVLAAEGERLKALAPDLEWVGYLSTTGVYGDRGGDWVDEESPLTPATERGARRLAAEQAWAAFGRETGVPVHLFRLAGIYGPHRNQLKGLSEGTARRIVKPGQVFSRIHVTDIAAVLEASIARDLPSTAFNVCDDEPAPPQDVVAYAAELMGIAPPPEIAFEDADLSPMAASFYAESKRCSNHRIKRDLEVTLTYPTYREGLRALYEEGAF